MALMSKTEFAKLIDKSKQYVSQLEKMGRLVMSGNKVVVDASLKRIAETSDPTKIAVAERHAEDREAKNQVDKDLTGIITAQENFIDSYQELRRKEKLEELIKKRRENQRESGELLHVDDVKKAVLSIHTTVRNKFEAMPDIVAPQLAAEINEQKIRVMLIDYIEQTLSDLSKEFRTGAVRS